MLVFAPDEGKGLLTLAIPSAVFPTGWAEPKIVGRFIWRLGAEVAMGTSSIRKALEGGSLCAVNKQPTLSLHFPLCSPKSHQDGFLLLQPSLFLNYLFVGPLQLHAIQTPSSFHNKTVSATEDRNHVFSDLLSAMWDLPVGEEFMKERGNTPAA